MSHAVMHVWRVSRPAVASALWRMAVDRVALRGAQGLRFHKLLGTGDGTTFAARDADPLTWALLTEWDTRAASVEFEASPTVRAWRRIAVEEWRGDLVPLRSRGQWAGATPFQPDTLAPRDWPGPIAAITRARIKPAHWPRFWRSVPEVVADLAAETGPVVRLGIGEAPVGVQGTFTIWPDAGSLASFAYRRAPHRAAIAATEETGWYSEDLFARLAVVEERGTLFGRTRTARFPKAIGVGDA